MVRTCFDERLGWCLEKGAEFQGGGSEKMETTTEDMEKASRRAG